MIDADRLCAILSEMAALGLWRELQAVAMLAFTLRAQPTHAVALSALIAVHETIVELFAQQLRQDLRAAAALQACLESMYRNARRRTPAHERTRLRDPNDGAVVMRLVGPVTDPRSRCLRARCAREFRGSDES